MSLQEVSRGCGLSTLDVEDVARSRRTHLRRLYLRVYLLGVLVLVWPMCRREGNFESETFLDRWERDKQAVSGSHWARQASAFKIIRDRGFGLGLFEPLPVQHLHPFCNKTPLDSGYAKTEIRKQSASH